MNAHRPLITLAILAGIATSTSGCGDSKEAAGDAGTSPDAAGPGLDGGGPPALVDAGDRPDATMVDPDAKADDPRCCSDDACTKPDQKMCDKGETCALEPDGTPGLCTSECPKEQRCEGLCCPYGAQCTDGTCELGDLAAERDKSTWPYPTSMEVEKTDCRVNDRCLPKAGRYTLLETTVRVKNVGNLPYHMSVRDDALIKRAPASFCQESYLLEGFIDVKLKDANGKVVREDQPPTLCTREKKGRDYLCAVSGLDHSDTVDLPAGECNQLDITGLEAGDYTVEVTVNPKHMLAEKSFDNNTASWTFTHTGCDGFVCGGECCEPGVLCVDGVCGGSGPDGGIPDGGWWPGDGGIDGPTPVTGNATCETAYALPEPGKYVTDVAGATVAPKCGAEGGAAFFKFTLDHSEVVYLDAFDSYYGTSLSLYKDGCASEPVRCESDDCSYGSGRIVAELGAGTYVVEARTQYPDTDSKAVLQFLRTGETRVKLIDRAGVYVGDTSKSIATPAGTCGWDWGGGFGGGFGGGNFGGDGFEESAPAMDSDPGMSTGGFAGGGSGGGAGGGSGGFATSGSGGSATGGVSDAGIPSPDDAGFPGDGEYSFNGPNDVYVMAACDSSPVVSTCGTSMFDSAIGIFRNELGGKTDQCSQLDSYGCQSDPNGAAMEFYSWQPGLTYIVVGGETPEASGEYQLYVAY